MAPGVATKVISASFGLTAFAVGIVAGMLAGNPAETILLRSLIAMVIAQAVGYIVGTIGERTINEGLAASEIAQNKGPSPSPGPTPPEFSS